MPEISGKLADFFGKKLLFAFFLIKISAVLKFKYLYPQGLLKKGKVLTVL